MNSVEQIIEDKELGILRIRTLQRARRLTFRTKSDAIYVSVPPSATRAEIMQAIRQLRPQLLLAKRKLQKPVIDLNYRIQAATRAEIMQAIRQLRPQLLLAKRKLQKPVIDLNYRIQADCFKLSLVQGILPHFLVQSDAGCTQIVCPPETDFGNAHLQEWLRQVIILPHFLVQSDAGCTQIVCPPETDFGNAHLQEWLRQVIVEALRNQAKAMLPSRLHTLSCRHGLPYQRVKINASSGRWGSCSSTQSINLSLYLMLLPSHLIDYVLLHELAHTIMYCCTNWLILVR